MENNGISYRPFKTDRIASIFLLPTGLLSAFYAGMYIATKLYSAITILLLIVIVTIILLCKTSRYSAILVNVNEQGIYIAGEQSQAFRVIPWSSILNGQYANSFRNHRFLVLSSHPLTSAEAKKLANQSANKSQVYLSGNVVLHLDYFQDTAPLIDYIMQHVDISNAEGIN